MSEKQIIKWHIWVQDCVALKRCIECEDPPVRGELRCRAHKEWNKVRSLVWVRENAAYLSNKAKLRNIERKNAGLCTGCGKIPPRTSAYTRCEPCAARKRRYDKCAGRVTKSGT